MAEAKDPAIKLFGKTIPLQEVSADDVDGHVHDVLHENDDDDDVVLHDDGDEENDVARNDDDDDYDSRVSNQEPPSSTNDTDYMVDEERQSDKGDQDVKTFQTKHVGVSPEFSDKITCQDASSETTDNAEASSTVEEKAAAGESSKSEEEKTEMSATQEKTPKKPDKILLCPRCNSMDTKFCYYNNYNVNQPRHFCKNCQRYWTAGGTMRNVPVGAGRRKNKNSASHYRHITIPEALHHSRQDFPNGVHPSLPTNGAVLTFSSDAPLCESMASILNIAEKNARNGQPNGFQKPDELKISIPFRGSESGGNHHIVDGPITKDDCSRSTLQEPAAAQNCLPYPQIPCYPGGPWPYPWNSTQWSPPVAAPPFCSNGFAMPFYPAYWGCTLPGTWNIPWVAQTSPPSHSNSSSGPNSPLGKHSRDGSMLSSNNSEEKELEENNSERSLWIPKTLRIDDPEEAAKSSIWTTLGIKNNEKPESIGRGSGLFKAFQSKRDEGNPHMETSALREANPAALSRSQNFQENS